MARNGVDVDQVPISKKKNDEKIVQLERHFVFKYGCEPDAVIRVPGRVNIIGEHIDYCGYPVLPMALAQDILLAVKMSKDSSLRISNANEKYDDFSTMMDRIQIGGRANGPAWYEYVLCGIRGALEVLNDKVLAGVMIAVSGNVPPASGLSSSSALVSAAALAILHVNNVKLSKREMSAICAKCERYIGTEGGGMDQAIAFLAVEGCAQYITWDPVCATSISLPSDAAFVVAHSLVEANKAATGDFNQRVMECRLGVKALAIKNNVYSQLLKYTFSELQRALKHSTEDMVKLVKLQLKQQPYSRVDLCNILQISNDELNERHLTKNVKHVTDFKLYQRALHVFQEAQRVEMFKNICYKEEGDEGHKMKILGHLMRESHRSLQHLYECSHPNLDRLVELSDDFGAHARLTGAGWGGCIVALCPSDRTYEYVSMLKEQFYDQHPSTKGKDISSLIFVTTPKQGAEIFI